MLGEKRRRGVTARRDVERRQNTDDDKKQLPSRKLQRPFKGDASRHLQYQQCLKEAGEAVFFEAYIIRRVEYVR